MARNVQIWIVSTLSVALLLWLQVLGGGTAGARLLGPDACPGARFVIPSEGRLGWTYRYPDSAEPTIDPRHSGIDILGSEGDPIYAAYDGQVKRLKGSHGVHILHPELNVETYYAHMSVRLVNTPNATVQRGDLIGYKGKVGTPLEHLHFSVHRPGLDERYTGNTFDPSSYLGANVNYDHGAVRWDHVTVKESCDSPVSAERVAVALVLDATGSMDNNDPSGLRKQAAKAFIDNAQVGDRIAVVSFNNRAHHLAPLREIQSDADRVALKAAVDQVGDSGSTNLNAGLDGGFAELSADTQSGPKAALFLTDGIQTSGSYQNQSHLQYQARGWKVYTIGLSQEADQALLQQIAQQTGGQYRFLADAGDLQPIYFELSEQIASGRLLLEQALSLLPGENEVALAAIPPQQRESTFFVSWSNGFVESAAVEVKLVGPQGRVITAQSSAPDLYQARGETYHLITIAHPDPGQWRVELTGNSVAPAGEEVSLRVAATGRHFVHLPALMSQSSQAMQPPPNGAPFIPSAPLPANGTTIAASEVVTLSWQALDPNGDELHYDFHFGTSSPPPLHTEDQYGPVHYMSDLAPNRTYYWRVVSQDDAGGSRVGPIWSFSVGDPPAPIGELALAMQASGNVELFRMRADGSGVQRLTTNNVYDWGPSWSPDGQQLAFASGRDNMGTNELYRMNADGSGATRLTHNSYEDFGAAWSPDGSRIAYKSLRSSFELRVMDVQGGNDIPVATHLAGDWRLSWSPDGQRIAFSAYRGGNEDLYSINADGSGLTRLTTHAASETDVAWSPDGSRLAFVSQRDGNSEIYVMALTSGAVPTRLTFNSAVDSIPDWSPDGSQIVFTSYRDGYGAIYRMNADGSNQTRISPIGQDSSYAVWRP